MAVLKTNREAMADYSWHPESKFENAERDSTGITQRRHVEAIAIEYIGKEANQLEEQYYLGELPEAQIEYGSNFTEQGKLIAHIKLCATQCGMETLASAAGIWRQQLHSILSRGAIPTRDAARRLCSAILPKRRK